MESGLRPLSLGEILDRTAQLYRSHFLVFAGIFSLYAGVALVLNLLQIGLGALLQRGQSTPSITWSVVATGVVEWVILLLLLGAVVAAINRAVSWVHLGEPATIRSAYAGILPRLGRYLWLMTLTGTLAWLPLALAYGGYFVFVMLYVRPRGILTRQAHAVDQKAMLTFALVSIVFFLIVLVAFVYAVVMSLRYALAVPACVVEDLTARDAVRRSIALSKGARGRIFVLFLLVGVIKLGLFGVTQAFFFVLVFKNRGQVAPWLNALSQVVAFFTNTFVGPIGAAGVAVFYYDQRVRKEGYDIERMMQAAGWAFPQEIAPTSSGVNAHSDMEPLGPTAGNPRAEVPLPPIHPPETVSAPFPQDAPTGSGS